MMNSFRLTSFRKYSVAHPQYIQGRLISTLLGPIGKVLKGFGSDRIRAR